MGKMGCKPGHRIICTGIIGNDAFDLWPQDREVVREIGGEEGFAVVGGDDEGNQASKFL